MMYSLPRFHSQRADITHHSAYALCSGPEITAPLHLSYSRLCPDPHTSVFRTKPEGRQLILCMTVNYSLKPPSLLLSWLGRWRGFFRTPASSISPRAGFCRLLFSHLPCYSGRGFQFIVKENRETLCGSRLLCSMI